MELRDENQRYRAYLEQCKLDERNQQIERDRLLQIELDRQNAMRAEKMRAEKEKREKLLREVIQGRQQQLLERSKIHWFLIHQLFCHSIEFRGKEDARSD